MCSVEILSKGSWKVERPLHDTIYRILLVHATLDDSELHRCLPRSPHSGNLARPKGDQNKVISRLRGFWCKVRVGM